MRHGRDVAEVPVRVRHHREAGDAVTQAFASIGWGWGGNWNSLKDYQHFSANGR